MILNLSERTLIETGIFDCSFNFIPETGEKLCRSHMSVENNKLFTNMSAEELLYLFNDMLTCYTYCPFECNHEHSSHYSTSEVEDEVLRRLNEYDRISAGHKSDS